MKDRTSLLVKFLNNYLANSDNGFREYNNTEKNIIKYYLTEYIHTSHSLRFTNPELLNKSVDDFWVYKSSKTRYAHKTNTIILLIKDNKLASSVHYEIGLFNFKKYLRHHMSLYGVLKCISNI